MRISDWSSDVCSSDLLTPTQPRAERERRRQQAGSWRGVRPMPSVAASADSDTADPATIRPLTADEVAAYHRDGFVFLPGFFSAAEIERSEEHTSELQSLMRISYAVFCLKKKTQTQENQQIYKHKH